MRAAAQRVLAGKLDLSEDRALASRLPTPTPDSEASSVPQLTDPKNRQDFLRFAEREGADAMRGIGFEDRETYYFNPKTDERVLKRRKTGQLPDTGHETPYRPGSVLDKAGRLGDVAEEFVRGLPARVIGSEAGLAMPFAGMHAIGQGVQDEIREAAKDPFYLTRPGSGFHRGIKEGWEESPITKGIAVVQRDVVEPARERLLDATTKAGLSPWMGAATESSQMVAGEALNPGNYVGLEMLRAGATAEKLGALAMGRRAALESQGGARAIEEADMLTREFGRGSAPSEILQGKAARSGDFSLGAKEPLVYYDENNPSPGWKGIIPDTVRKATGKPWRTYAHYDAPLTKPTSPAPRPRSVNRPPIEVDVIGGMDDQRERFAGLWDYASRRYPSIVSTVKQVRIGTMDPGTARFTSDGVMDLSYDFNLPLIMHELTHAAQGARGKLPEFAPGKYADIANKVEPHPVRVGDVYGRIPEPSPRTFKRAEWEVTEPGVNGEGWGITQDADGSFLVHVKNKDKPYVVRGGRSPREEAEELLQIEKYKYRMNDKDEQTARVAVADSTDLPATSGPSDLSGRFAGFLSRNGLDNPDTYYDLDPKQRTILDRKFAAEDTGPGTAAWNQFLDSNDLRQDDYFALSLPERAKLESDFRMQTRQAIPEPDEPNVPDFWQDPDTAKWHVGDSDRVFDKKWEAQAERDRLIGLDRGLGEQPFRAYAQGPTPPLPSPMPPVPLPEEIVAEQMGWKIPAGSPHVTGPPIRLPEFQTNIAAQLGGDEQAANYIIQHSDEVHAAIGPPESWDTLEAMAALRGETKEELLSRNSRWHVLSPELRLRLLYIEKGERIEIGKLQGKLVAGQATDTDKAELLRLIESQGDLIRLGASTGSAYGRALNSLKIEARLALSDSQLLRQKLYRQYSKQLDNEKPLMDALARLDPDNPEELATFLRAVNKPKFHEYLQEYWVASILSGPATHQRNIIGNAVNAALENAVVRPTSAMWDAAKGGEREVFLRETGHAVAGLTVGIREGVRRGWQVARRGYDVDTMSGKLYLPRSAFARSQNRVVRETIGPVVTMPLRLLVAEDAIFKTMNHTAEIYAQAARIASKEIRSGALSPDGFSARAAHLVSNPTDKMIEAADAFALKATFNDPASAIGQSMIDLRDRLAITVHKDKYGQPTKIPIGGFIFPFIKIADRLMVRGFEYSPIGFAKAGLAATRAESVDMAARASIGSVVLAYAASLAMEGRITGGAPTDPAEKAAFFEAHKQAWSIRTDDGTWIPYGGLLPIGTPFAIAASFWKGWTENGESPDVEKLGHAAAQIGAYVSDQSYMDGLSKMMDVIGGTKSEQGRAFSDLATNTTWGFSPYSGLTRTVARAVDPRLIDAERIQDRLAQNIPGISLGMDARLTPWGEEVIPTGGRLRSVLAPGSVLLMSREKSDPLDKELQRLGMPLGLVGKTISDSVKGERSKGPWKLSPDEWRYYQQTAGRTTKLILTQVFAQPEYWNEEQGETSIETQRERVTRAIGIAREYAKIMTVRYHRNQGPGYNPTLGAAYTMTDNSLMDIMMGSEQ